MAINLNSIDSSLNSAQINYKIKQGVNVYNQDSLLKNTQTDIVDIKKDASNDGKFTVWEALKNFGKGFVNPIKSIIEHPILTLGSICATAALVLAMPALAPIMLVGFGAYGVFELGKGIYKAKSEYLKGNFDESEKAFQSIGSGTIGTILSALGVKPTAIATVQAKRATEMGGQLSLIHKYVINQQIKEKNIFNALKENISILITKQGWATIKDSLNPQKIIERIKFLRPQKPGTEKWVQKYWQTAEGKKRLNMSPAELKKEVVQIYNKVFEEMGIPISSRPKLVIIENLRYLSPQEANTVLTKYISTKLNGKQIAPLKIFKSNEVLKNIPTKQLVARIKTRLLEIPEIKTANLNLDKDITNMVKIVGNKVGGSYNRRTHTIIYHTNPYRTGLYSSIEDVIVHEALHAKMMLLRNSLPKEQVASAIKQELLKRIKTGEYHQIIKDPKTQQIMTPPSMDIQMRQSFLNFAEKFLYKSTDSSDILNYVQKRKILSKQLFDTKINGKMDNVSKLNSEVQALDKANPEFFTEIETMIANNPNYVSKNGGPQQAYLTLLDYIAAHENRYITFSQEKLPNIQKFKLTPQQLTEAVNSTRGNISTREGNMANQLARKTSVNNSRAFSQYANSYEEVLARNTANKYQIRHLQRKNTNPNISSEERKINIIRSNIIKKTAKFNMLSKRYYDLETYVRNNPMDTDAVQKCAKAKQACEALLKNLEDYKKLIVGNNKVFTKDFYYQSIPLAIQVNKKIN